jgi:Secretion system C-terminal sorting domain
MFFYTSPFYAYICANKKAPLNYKTLFSMNNFFKIIWAAFGLLAVAMPSVAWGQENTQLPLAPDGVLDAVFDRFGNKYTMRDIQINTTTENQSTGLTAPTNTLLCGTNSGYFDVWYETGSGFQGNQPAINALCKVFADISNFIPRPVGATGRVNIWVRNPTNMNLSPNLNFLGLATGFHSVPTGTPATFSGIADNELWKTINSGVNSYTNVVPPVMTQGGPNATVSGLFAHGIVAFKFGGTNWYYGTNATNIGNGQYDFYTVALHEVLHALGFGTLMNGQGQSIFANNGLKYYSRYDRFLQTQAGVPLLTHTGAINAYNYTPMAGIGAILTHGASAPCNNSNDCTDCARAVNYVGGTTRAVYTPDTWSQESSLSHFEDMCAPFNHPQTAQNTGYVMTNATPTVKTQRFPDAAERQVLCNLGYNVQATYGSTYGSTTYQATVCNNNTTVVGVNDGLTGNTYSYLVGQGATINIPIADIRANDINATGITGVEDVLGQGTATIVGTNIRYVANANTGGVALIRYVPVNGTIEGNITYIYVYINQNCGATAPCNMVINGGFENLNATPTNSWAINRASCVNQYIYSCDLWTPAAPATNTVGYLPSNFDNIGIGTNIRAGGSANTNCAGFAAAISTEETFRLALVTPITQGNYTLRFWARVHNSFNSNGSIDIAGHEALFSQYSQSSLFPPSPVDNQLHILQTSAVTIPNNGEWQPYSISFTYNGIVPLRSLIIAGNNSLLNGNFESYMLIDDIELMPAANVITFTPPTTTCSNGTITNLMQYVNTPGGTFTGVGNAAAAVQNGNFNATGLTAGFYTIQYTPANASCNTPVYAQIQVTNTPQVGIAFTPYPNCGGGKLTATNANGTYAWSSNNSTTAVVNITTAGTYTVTFTDVCSNTATASVTIANAQFTSTGATPTISGTTTVATGQSTTLTATGGTTYQWSTGATTASITVTPTATTTYTVTASNAAGCTVTQTVTIALCIPPTVTLYANPTTICAGQPSTLTAMVTPTSIYTYTWSITGMGVSTESVLPTTTTTYTVTVTTANGCTATKSVTVTVNPLPSPTITSTFTNCATTLTATSTAPTTYLWSTGAITPTISSNTAGMYTVTATSTNGCISTRSAAVTVQVPPPPPTITGTTSLGITTLTASAIGTNTFTWSTTPVQNTVTINVSPTTTTTYTVTLTTATGCTSTASITVNPLCSTSGSNAYNYTSSTTIDDLSAAEQTNAVYNVASNVVLTIATSGAFQSCTFNMGANSSIVFGSDVVWKVNNCVFQPCGNALWTGIVQDGNISWLSTSISGAKRAIDIQARTARNNIQACTFQNNDISIYIDGTLPDPQMFTCAGSTFSANPNNTNQQIGNIGIFITNAATKFTIGGAIGSGNRNLFTSLRKGIMTLDASVDIQESKFTNIAGYGNTAIEAGSAIHAKTSNGRDYTAAVKGWGTTNSAATYAFTNCTFGAYIQSNHFNIENTAMDNMSTGIRAELCANKFILIGNALSGVVSLGPGNRINATNRGIAIISTAGSTAGRCEIANNQVLLMTTATTTAQGIAIEEPSNSNPIPTTIFNNTVTMNGSTVDGVFVRNANGLSMSNNTVTINNPNSAETGINLQNCISISTSCNKVRNATLNRGALSNAQNLMPIALRIVGTRNSTITDFNTSHTYTGIRMDGNCSGTQLQGTQFFNHTRGLWIFAGTTQAANATVSLHNQKGNNWVDNANYTAQNGCNAAYWGNANTPNTTSIPPVFRYNSNSSVANLNPANKQPNAQNWFTPVSAIGPDPTYIRPANCANNTGSLLLVNANPVLDIIDQTVATNTIEFGNYQAEAKEQANRYLYEKLLDIDNNYIAGTVFGTFRDSIEANSNIPDLVNIKAIESDAYTIAANQAQQLAAYRSQIDLYQNQIDSLNTIFNTITDSVQQTLINTNILVLKQLCVPIFEQQNFLLESINTAKDLKIENAKTANNTFASNTLIEYNEKIINNIRLCTVAKSNFSSNSTGVSSFTPEQVAVIDYLSYQCPYLGGDAVHNARGLRALYSNDIYDDYFICGAVGIQARTVKPKDKTNESQILMAIKMYPNPSAGYAYLFVPQQYQGASITVTNMLGQVIQRYTASKTTEILDINDQENGTYIIQIQYEGRTTYTNKLVLIKP